MFCASCGTKLNDTARFCMACGAKIKMAADQQAVDSNLKLQISEVRRPQIPLAAVQRPPEKPSSVMNFILGGALIAMLVGVAVIYIYERSQPATQPQTPATQNTAPPTSQTGLVTPQPATPIEAAWKPYIKYAPCMASNGSLMQTFINNATMPTVPNATSALAACQ